MCDTSSLQTTDFGVSHAQLQNLAPSGVGWGLSLRRPLVWLPQLSQLWKRKSNSYLQGLLWGKHELMFSKCGAWCLTQRGSSYYNWAKRDLCSLLIALVFCRNHVFFLEQLRSTVIFGTKQSCEVVRGSSLSFCVPQGRPILWLPDLTQL